MNFPSVFSNFPVLRLFRIFKLSCSPNVYIVFCDIVNAFVYLFFAYNKALLMIGYPSEFAS